MSEYDDLLPEDETKKIELPPLMTAADLLDDPLAGIPVSDDDEETPPDPTPLTDKAHGVRGTPERDAWEQLQRERREQADAEIAGHPAIVTAMEQEQVRLAQKQAVQEAFVKAWKEKNK